MQESTNAANPVVTAKAGRERIPMSVPRLKLSVPEIPGFVCYWMRGDKTRIDQALQGGYEFVQDNEVTAGSGGIADDVALSGSTDLGSRISVSAGNALEDGHAIRLYLMKIKREWWLEDQATQEVRSEQTAQMLRGGAVNPQGSEKRYIPNAHKRSVQTLFTPKLRRA